MTKNETAICPWYENWHKNYVDMKICIITTWVFG